jgi:hypothetical protein
MNPNPQVAGLIEEGEAFRTLSAKPAAPAVPKPLARRDRVFHTAMSVAFLVTAFLGFAPTYFLRGFSTLPPLSPLLHIHGLVFTAWLVLVVIQSGLIKADRVRLHMTLGIGGAILAAVMVPLVIMVSIAGFKRGAAGINGDDPVVFLIFPIGQAFMFGGVMAAAIWKRKNPEIHRRLIIVANAIVISPAISRMPFGGNPMVSLFLTTLFIVAGMVHDRWSGRRIHPVYLWSAVLLLLSGPVRFGLGHTAAWRALAQFMAQ